MPSRSVPVALVAAIGVALLAIALFGTEGGAPGGGPPPDTAASSGRDGDAEVPESPGAIDPGTSVFPDSRKSRLEIRVESESGDAVAGALVTIRGGGAFERFTGDDGLSTFDGIPAGSYEVLVSADGYPDLSSTAAVRVSGGRVEAMRCIARQFDASVSGRVLDSRGAPLAGVTARCAPVRQHMDEIVMERAGPPSQADSDGLGRFKISGLAAGEYTIETEARTGYSQARQNIISPSEGLLLVLNEEQSIIISGVVTDPESQPLEGAEVIAAIGGSARTDAEGRFRLPVKASRAPGSTLTLSARKAGYSEQYKTMAVPRPATEELELSFRLDVVTDAGTLLGLLVDTNGSPVPAESVQLQSVSRAARYQARASADGRFRFDGVRSADDYVLTVFPTADYWDHTIDPVEIRKGVNELEVVLEPIETATFNGTLVDALGTPVPHLTVWVKNLEKRAGAVRVASDSTGSFRARVPAGGLVIETRALPKVTISEIHVEPGQEFSATLPVGMGDRTVRGRVVWPDGSPVPGARVVVTWSHRGTGFHSTLYNEAISDRSGSFEFAGLGPGACSVSVSAVGAVSTRVSIQIPRGSDPDRLRIELR